MNPSHSFREIAYLQKMSATLSLKSILRTDTIILIRNTSPTSCRHDLITERNRMNSHSEIFEETLSCIVSLNLFTISVHVLYYKYSN